MGRERVTNGEEKKVPSFFHYYIMVRVRFGASEGEGGEGGRQPRLERLYTIRQQDSL